MDIYEIGKLLKEEREKRGLTREDVYRATKISIMNIEAIEKGNMDMLPHPVYTRGFIKSYAEFLEIDPIPLLQAYEKNTSSITEEVTKDPQTKPLSIKATPRSKLWFFMILFVILVGLTIVLFKIRNHQMQQFNKKRSSILKEVPEASEIKKKSSYIATNNTQERTYNKNETNNTSLMIVGSSTNATNSTNSSTFLKKNTNASIHPNISNSTLVSSKNASETIKKISEFHELKVIATALCWMRGRMDDNSTKVALLRKGEEVMFKFQHHMDLKLGNAGGVEIFLDGKPVSFKARSGEVKTLHFPLKNNG